MPPTIINYFLNSVLTEAELRSVWAVQVYGKLLAHEVLQLLLQYLEFLAQLYIIFFKESYLRPLLLVSFFHLGIILFKDSYLCTLLLYHCSLLLNLLLHFVFECSDFQSQQFTLRYILRLLQSEL